LRLCAIDVGTNTVLSLVADVADGRLTILADEERFARLGQGVDASRRLADDAMDRVVAALAAARATADRLGAERTVIAATSASRDASNVDVLVERVRRELSLDYAVISGEREAALSFAGAFAMLPGDAPPAAAVVDIGGGSTEIAVGDRRRGVVFRQSLDVGSVRLTERHLRPAPPSAAAVAAATADVRAALATVPRDAVGGLPLVLTGSVARLLARLDGAASDAPWVPAAAVRAWRDRMLVLPPEGVLALAPDALAGREDVAGAAALVVAEVLDALGADGFTATRGGLRHGLALAAAREESAEREPSAPRRLPPSH